MSLRAAAGPMGRVSARVFAFANRACKIRSPIRPLGHETRKLSSDNRDLSVIKAGIIGATGYTGVELLRLLSRHPEVDVVALGPEDLFMVLACDGVWDVLTNEEVVDLAVRHPGDPRRAAALIVKEAERKQSADNITATVVQFAWNADRAEAVLAKFREAGGHGGARAGTPDSELDMFADEGGAGGAGFAGFLGPR